MANTIGTTCFGALKANLIAALEVSGDRYGTLPTLAEIRDSQNPFRFTVPKTYGITGHFPGHK